MTPRSAGKSPRNDKAADEGGSVLDDLPYAEEDEPAIEEVSAADDDDSPEPSVKAVPDPEPDPDEATELSDEALEEAALLVQNDLSALTRERDEYLEGLKRVQAEFENYRKRVMAQQAEHAERAAEGLAAKLLPVLDACDAAIQHAAEGVEPIFSQLMDTLTKEGLERIDPEGDPFDPNFHDAVMHEEGDEGDGAIVSEVLRPGYSWKGRVLRPAMVKVKG